MMIFLSIPCDQVRVQSQAKTSMHARQKQTSHTNTVTVLDLVVTSVGILGNDLSFGQLLLERLNALVVGQASGLQRLTASVHTRERMGFNSK